MCAVIKETKYMFILSYTYQISGRNFQFTESSLETLSEDRSHYPGRIFHCCQTASYPGCTERRWQNTEQHTMDLF
jgi:hypothetical protein